MEAICYSETLVDTRRTTRCYIPEDGTLHNHRCENLKSHVACGALYPRSEGQCRLTCLELEGRSSETRQQVFWTCLRVFVRVMTQNITAWLNNGNGNPEWKTVFYFYDAARRRKRFCVNTFKSWNFFTLKLNTRIYILVCTDTRGTL
jgi:hypothetical protein